MDLDISFSKSGVCKARGWASNVPSPWAGRRYDSSHHDHHRDNNKKKIEGTMPRCYIRPLMVVWLGSDTSSYLVIWFVSDGSL